MLDSAAIDALNSIGASDDAEAKNVSRDLKFVDLSSTPADDTCLPMLLRLSHSLAHLRLDGCRISPAGIVQLASNLPLASLWIGGYQVSRESMVAIANHKLRELNVFGPDVNDGCLTHLPSFSQLNCLAITCSAITDAGLSHLPDIGNVRTLCLNGNPRLTDECCERIQGIVRVESIYFAVTNVTNRGKERLRQRFSAIQVGP